LGVLGPMKKNKIYLAILLLFFMSNSHAQNADNSIIIDCKEDEWVKKVDASKFKIIASSVLPSFENYNYTAENLLD
jgi:hypothetical protein